MIADCISLFSLGKLDPFPVDTWIRKVMFLFQKQKNLISDSPCKIMGRTL